AARSVARPSGSSSAATVSRASWRSPTGSTPGTELASQRHPPRRGSGRRSIRDPIQQRTEPAPVRELDREPGTRVQLEDERSVPGVDDDVDAHEAEADRIRGARGQPEDVVPRRHGHAGERHAEVRVDVAGAPAADAMRRPALRQIYADADSAQMEVRAAIGAARGNAEHR